MKISVDNRLQVPYNNRKEVNIMFWEATYLDNYSGYYIYVYFQANRFSDYIGKYNFDPIPQRLRLVVSDQELKYMRGKQINFFQYVYRKYIKAPNNFPFGYRLNWEKEKV